MSDVFEGLEPALVWQHFYNINQIPRCSKNEEGARQYVKSFAEKLNLPCKEDEAGNIVIKKAATPGYEDRPVVVLQSHLDMVCEKNRDVLHDFTKDPIKMLKEDGWVRAEGTTLGADNAIGVSMGLALLEDNSLEHPAVEVLCTVDEETGMTGAMGLQPEFLQGRILLNLDTEEEDTLYIGCAGGKHTEMFRKIEWHKSDPSLNTVSLKIKGLRGGHSGMNIIDQFGNALKLLSRILFQLGKEHNYDLADIHGGSAHNAIPREAEAIFQIDDAGYDALVQLAREFQHIFNEELKFVEKNIIVLVEKMENEGRVFGPDLTRSIVRLIYSVPHGVTAMSQAVKNLVETSTNMAMVETRANELYLLTSQRSSIASSIADIADKVRSIAELAGFRVEQGGGYPSWTPDPDSPLLKVCAKVYEEEFGIEPGVKAVHAGLECGIIGQQYPGIDMISFGPDIVGAHSPNERVKIASVKNVWNYLLAVLKRIE